MRAMNWPPHRRRWPPRARTLAQSRARRCHHRDRPAAGEAAAAQLRQAYLNAQRMAIVAPVSGYVAKRSVQLGQRVQPARR
jgi:multidrug resistance efflux pump